MSYLSTNQNSNMNITTIIYIRLFDIECPQCCPFRYVAIIAEPDKFPCYPTCLVCYIMRLA